MLKRLQIFSLLPVRSALGVLALIVGLQGVIAPSTGALVDPNSDFTWKYFPAVNGCIEVPGDCGGGGGGLPRV